MNYAKLLILPAFLIGLSAGAFAHSKIDTTSPENGVVLTQVPASIDLSFDKKIRLIKVSLQLDGQAPIDLDLNGYKDFENDFSFPNISEGVGEYKIEWRGLGMDGHVMQGGFTFTVK